MATKFSDFSEYKNHLGTIYKMPIPGPRPQILGSVKAREPAFYTNVPGDAGIGDPWAMLRNIRLGNQADLG